MLDHYALFVGFFMTTFLLISFYVATVMQLCARLQRHHRTFFNALGSPNPTGSNPLPLHHLLRAFLNRSLFALHDPGVNFLGCLAALLAVLGSVSGLFAVYLGLFA